MNLFKYLKPKDLVIPIIVGAVIYLLLTWATDRAVEKERQQDAAILELQNTKMVIEGLQLEMWAMERVLLKNNIVSMADLNNAKAETRSALAATVAKVEKK